MKKLIPAFLCLFLFSGCGEAAPEPPKFDFTATCEAEDFTGEVISGSSEPIEVKTVTPEALSGMTAKAGNSVVVVSFMGTAKSSEAFPAVRDFNCSRAALMLDTLRSTQLVLSGREGDKITYSAETYLGELTLVTDIQGNILTVSQEKDGFTLRLCHQDNQSTQP